MRDKGGILTVTLQEHSGAEGEAISPVGQHGRRYIRLTVGDTGHGMTREVQERIFEPYFTTKTKGEGTGLGLSVVHGIVEGHHGFIQVRSQPGHGSKFLIDIPCIEEEDGGAQHSLDEELPHGKGEKVLVVDDEEMISSLLVRLLESLGYQAEASNSSEEALDLFLARAEEFDLVLTDMSMPGLTGVMLSKAILSIRPEIPVILCTGFSEQINEESAKRIGITSFLLKPVVKRQLAHELAHALRSTKQSPGKDQPKNIPAER
jgi:CheY-like chemotaxis protein